MEGWFAFIIFYPVTFNSTSSRRANRKWTENIAVSVTLARLKVKMMCGFARSFSLNFLFFSFQMAWDIAVGSRKPTKETIYIKLTTPYSLERVNRFDFCVCAIFSIQFLRGVDLKTYMQMIYNAKQKATTTLHTNIQQWQNWKYSRSYKSGSLKQQAIRISIYCVYYWRCLFWFCFRFPVLLNSRETIDSVIGQSFHEYAWDAKPIGSFAAVVRHHTRVLKRFGVPFAATVFHANRKLNWTHCSQCETNWMRRATACESIEMKLNATKVSDRVPKTPAHGLMQCFAICMLHKLRGRNEEHKTEMLRLDVRVPELDYTRSRN